MYLEKSTTASSAVLKFSQNSSPSWWCASFMYSVKISLTSSVTSSGVTGFVFFSITHHLTELDLSQGKTSLQRFTPWSFLPKSFTSFYKKNHLLSNDFFVFFRPRKLLDFETVSSCRRLRQPQVAESGNLKPTTSSAPFSSCLVVEAESFHPKFGVLRKVFVRGDHPYNLCPLLIGDFPL